LKKVAILIPQFPGQTHMFFWNEIKALEDSGVEVHIFSTRRPINGLVSHTWSDDAVARTTYLNLGGMKDKMEAAVRLPGWLAAARRQNPDAASAKSVALSAPAAIALRDACAARDISHVHAHSAANCAMIAALCKRAGGPKYSVTLHGPVRDYGPAQAFKWGTADFGIVITKVLAKELADIIGGATPDDLYVCGMGVDTEKFKPAKDYAPWTGDGPLRLFTCARLNIVKGHETTVAALEILKQDGIEAQLTIAGEDDAGGAGYRKTLENAIARSAVSKQVTLLGAIDGETVLQNIQQAHAFVLASYAEPLGVAYMEAMACGCPTIGTDAGGVPELITHGVDGVLVPPQDPAALAAEIARVARDPKVAGDLSTTSRKRIVDDFGARRSAEIMVAGYNALQPR
jgi:glycosyltransferase involved in cell wall biosynthesis|tara:strand:+ start:3110 stop:4312 length:1203 start_codon:yes stop_codon:yes gene_type:complete